MELRVRAFGLAVGLIFGLIVLLGTWWLIILGGAGDIFSKISYFCFGYSFSWGGAVIGFIWIFVYGFIGGALLAWLYNMFYKMLYKPKS